MRTHAEIIDSFGGPGRFGFAIGVPASHARTMKARGSIPTAYWQDVVGKAVEFRIRGITYEALAKSSKSRRRRSTNRVAA